MRDRMRVFAECMHAPCLHEGEDRGQGRAAQLAQDTEAAMRFVRDALLHEEAGCATTKTMRGELGELIEIAFKSMQRLSRDMDRVVPFRNDDGYEYNEETMLVFRRICDAVTDIYKYAHDICMTDAERETYACH